MIITHNSWKQTPVNFLHARLGEVNSDSQKEGGHAQPQYALSVWVVCVHSSVHPHALAHHLQHVRAGAAAATLLRFLPLLPLGQGARPTGTSSSTGVVCAMHRSLLPARRHGTSWRLSSPVAKRQTVAVGRYLTVSGTQTRVTISGRSSVDGDGWVGVSDLDLTGAVARRLPAGQAILLAFGLNSVFEVSPGGNTEALSGVMACLRQPPEGVN